MYIYKSNEVKKGDIRKEGRKGRKGEHEGIKRKDTHGMKEAKERSEGTKGIEGSNRRNGRKGKACCR